jgi:hypothetical protein
MPSGYRMVYVDEIINSIIMRRAVKSVLDSWDIAIVINGYTNGSAYGNEAKKICDD